MKKDFLPIILGSDENAYGDVRLIREAYGIKPLLVCKRLLIPTRYSKLFDYELIENFDSEDIFADALNKVIDKYENEYEKFVVIPCSDYYANLMSKYFDSFNGRVANKYNPSSLIETFETKDRFYKLCDSLGIPYPKTIVVEYENRAPEKTLPFPFDYPVVMKPENSNSTDYLLCKFPEKKKVYYIHSDKEYEEAASAMTRAGYKGKLIVQEFIHGGDDAMRVINCYSTNDGELSLACMGQPLLEEYAPYTLGNYAAIISRGEDKLYDMVKRFLESIHYTGFSNFDVKYDEKKGQYYFFEINPRPGRSSFFVYAAGHNLMKAMIDDAVYNKPCETVYSHSVSLWSNVPMGIIKKYVKNKALLDEAMSMKKKCTYTLFCKGDKNIRRVCRITRYYLTHYKNYRRYYFNKGTNS